MESAKRSYQADIDSGFQMLHIDPSIDIWSEPSVDDILDRVFELYEFCWEYAQKKGQDIVFEIGTEEQNGGNNTQEELEYSLNRVVQFCQQNSLPSPLFIVIQAGTKVMETKNVERYLKSFGEEVNPHKEDYQENTYSMPAMQPLYVCKLITSIYSMPSLVQYVTGGGHFYVEGDTSSQGK